MAEVKRRHKTNRSLTYSTITNKGQPNEENIRKKILHVLRNKELPRSYLHKTISTSLKAAYFTELLERMRKEELIDTRHGYPDTWSVWDFPKMIENAHGEQSAMQSGPSVKRFGLNYCDRKQSKTHHHWRVSDS